MFKKKKSIVSQLDDEVGMGRYSRTGNFVEYILLGREKDENEEMFAELLSSYIEDKIEEDYTECSECGCLIADEKVQYVVKDSEEIPYCKHCKPLYDEIVYEENVIKYKRNGVECDEKGKIIENQYLNTEIDTLIEQGGYTNGKD